jgi:hypothetical protein
LLGRGHVAQVAAGDLALREGMMEIEELPFNEEPKLCRVDPEEELPKLWDAVKPIMMAHPRGLLDVMSIEEVHHYIATGLYDLWVGVHERRVEVALITSLSRHAHEQPLFLIWGGGEGRKYWEVGHKTLEHFAQLIGATQIRVPGRRGVGRWAERFGYLEEQVVYVKKINQPDQKWSH